MLEEKIKQLMKLGIEAAKLNNIMGENDNDPALSIIWKNEWNEWKNNESNIEIEMRFFSSSLELDKEFGNKEENIWIVAKNETELEEKLDRLIMLAEREITCLSRKNIVGCN